MREYKTLGSITIELLISIVIICLLIFAAFIAFQSAGARARDLQRVADVTAIQSALKLYFTENGFYPKSSGAEMPAAMANYLSYWPVSPAADGSCTKDSNRYFYSQTGNADDYTLTFCLGRSAAGLTAGAHILTSKTIQ
ncbi:MAG: type II secretion system protein [Candidatus Doudnabacteria bacterium]